MFSLDAEGLFSDAEERYETPTSGGKANALDLLPKIGAEPSSSAVWILLTDDDDAAASPDGGSGVRVLEWDGWGTGVKEVVGWPSPGANGAENALRMEGGSHAIWLE